MACTCRSPARCPVCNAPVRVPLSNLESGAGGALLIDRFARRDSSASREGLRRINLGSAPCPNCGHPVEHAHTRACVADYLTSVGIPTGEREAILARVTFPEG
jgi:hypothetical protein